MISGIFHDGSGLGDQLFRYITVRTLAEEKGYGWGMLGVENFKGISFLNLDTGISGHVPAVRKLATGNQWIEKDTRDSKNNDIRSYDPEINFVEDNTVIDGSFEDSKYWSHNLQNIAKWLATEPLEVPDDTCVIGFRGGEYSAISQLFLPKSLYFKGVEIMKQRGVTNFEVHTDDPTLAKQFFPDFKVIDNTRLSHSKHSNMGYNWRAMRYAKHAIIPNSAFYILPRLLAHKQREAKGITGWPKDFINDKEGALTIAPRYWAGYNEKIWKRPACFYKPFTYIHADE